LTSTGAVYCDGVEAEIDATVSSMHSILQVRALHVVVPLLLLLLTVVAVVVKLLLLLLLLLLILLVLQYFIFRSQLLDGVASKLGVSLGTPGGQQGGSHRQVGTAHPPFLDEIAEELEAQGGSSMGGGEENWR